MMDKLLGPWSIAEFIARRGGRLMVVFDAYCDESEVGAGGSRVFTVAGAFAETESWQALGKRWREVLSLNAVPYFHATDLEALQGPYKGWEKWHKIAFQDDLIKVIGRVRPQVFGATVVLNDYDELSEVERRALGTPYEFCAQWSIRSVGHLLNQEPWKHLDGQVQYVFEELPHGSGRLSEAFMRTLESCPERRLAGPPYWALKKTTVELQVADMFAYEIGKDALRQSGVDSQATRKSLEALMECTQGRLYLFDKRTLRLVLGRGIAK